MSSWNWILWNNWWFSCLQHRWNSKKRWLIFSWKYEIFGCCDESACNFDPEANSACDEQEWLDTCEYAEEGFDCDGNCLVEIDCNGECGGDADFDIFGICNGDGTIQGAIDAAEEGSAIDVPQGWYSESIVINKPIVLNCLTGENCIIDA